MNMCCVQSGTFIIRIWERSQKLSEMKGLEWRNVTVNPGENVLFSDK